MQAIVSDIIVTQAPQTELQLSSNINISQNTQPSVSFADLLQSYSNNKVEDKPAEEKAAEKVEENLEKKDKIPEKNSTEKAKTETKTEEAKPSENVKKTDGEKEAKEVKNEIPSLKKNVKKTDSKEKASDKAEASDKKLSDEMNRMNQLISENSEEAVKNVPVQNSKSNLPKNDVQKKDMELSVDSEIEISRNDNDILKSKFKDDGNPKVSKLDKDGKIIVKDYRTEEAEREEPKETVKSNLKTDVKIDSDNTATITMDLAQNDTENNILSLNNQSAAADGSDFQAMLNNQIQQSAPDFVKAGSIILKNNDKGTINLILHPDDLGNVKIQLSLDGKSISGHITVNTKEALEVFKNNSQTLREAFVQNGFDGANFDVSYNSQNSNANQNFEQQYDGTEFLAKKVYGNSVNNSYEFDSNDYISADSGNYSINIVA